MSRWYSAPTLSIPLAWLAHREVLPELSEDMQAQGRARIGTCRRFQDPLASLGVRGPSFHGSAELSRRCRGRGEATPSAPLTRAGKPERVEGAGGARDARR